MHESTTSSQCLRLSDLTQRIKSVVADAFAQQSHWVVAEVVGHSFHAPSGHHYFELVEKAPQGKGFLARMRCTAWARDGARAIAAFEKLSAQPFRNGISVLANVTVQYSAAFGIQLCLNELDIRYAVGQLELQRKETLEQLIRLCPDFIRFDGNRYLTRNQGLRHAPVIQRVAVVTAEGAAGFKDFEHTIRNNKHGYKIALEPYFTLVQGEANADALCSRLVDIYRSGVRYDAVVVIRGGGSPMDLLIFEQFRLARAVAKFPIPIISGIGHQINETIVDLMAHTSVKTPSIAAEFILSHNRSFEEAVLRCQQTITIRAQQCLHRRQKQVSRLHLSVVTSGRQQLQDGQAALHRQYRLLTTGGRQLLHRHHSALQERGNGLLVRPRLQMAAKNNEFACEAANFQTQAKRFLLAQHASLAHFQSLCRANDPERILKKGFALLYRGDALLGNTSDIQPEESLHIRTADVQLQVTVQSIQQKPAP